MWTSRNSERTAIVDEKGESWNHPTLFRWVQLQSTGLGHITSGERVGLVLTNEMPSLVCLLALQHLGAVVVVLDPRAPRELWRDILNQAQTDKLIAPAGVADPGQGDLVIPNARPETDHCRPCDHSRDFRPKASPELAFIMPTSGTTGTPKLVPIGYRQLLASAEASRNLLQIEPTDHWICPLSLAHMGGISILYRTLIYGTSMTLLKGFEPKKTWKHLANPRTTRASLVPTMLHRMCADPPPHGDLSHLRTILVGGAAADVPTLKKAMQWGLPVCPTYGMTETSSQIATRTPWSSAPIESVGTCLPGTEVSIRNPSGQTVPAGTPGQVWVRGPSVVAKYVGKNEKEDGLTRFHDGWFRTGDRGHLDSEGHLFIAGRNDDVIVCGAVNLDPARIEGVVRQHREIQDVAVFARADPEWGERVVAAVVAVANRLPVDLFDHCRKSLHSLEVPSGWYLVGEIPQGRSGKINRRRLRETFSLRAPLSTPASGRNPPDAPDRVD